MPTLALDRLCLHPGAWMHARGVSANCLDPRAEAPDVSYVSQLAQHWVGTEEGCSGLLSGRNANVERTPGCPGANPRSQSGSHVRV